MHHMLIAVLACSSVAAAQEFTITLQFRAIDVLALAQDTGDTIDEEDSIVSHELFNFNENLFVEAEIGSAAAVAEASQTSLLDPTFIEVTSDMFTETIAKGERALAYATVDNVGVLGFTVDEPVTVLFTGVLSNEGDESGQMIASLAGGNGPIHEFSIGGGESLEFEEWIDLEPGAYELLNEQFAASLTPEEGVSGFAVISLGIATECFVDVNGDGVLNILDFVAYQALFVNGDPGADCDGDGALNILDFVCFQAAFLEGCG